MRATGSDGADECRCGRATAPPDGAKWWRPDFDTEPSAAEAPAVARYGEDPHLCRFIRVKGGWSDHGAMVNYYIHLSPPIPWERVGCCWDGRQHPVVAVRQEPDGTWVCDV